MTIIGFVLALIVIIALGYAAFWFIAKSAVPEPIAMLLRVLVLILGLFALYQLAIGTTHIAPL